MRAAEHLQSAKDAPWSVICFHAQQCAEKYMKALLLWRDIAFPKTHDLAKLLTLFPEPLALGWTPRDAASLTEHATAIRYPGEYEPASKEEAVAMLQLARRAREYIRTLLPEAALH